MRIIFYGTPEIAAYSLRYLYEKGHNIIAVVTNPDKPAGRGMKLRPSPVKQTALELGLPVLQPKSLKDPEFAKQIRELAPDLQLVLAFKILPRQIWEIPPEGTINLHTSYLPNYRGAAPINWVIINGEQYTGVTTFFINDNVDTGNIILREKVEILPDETAGELHDKLMVKGAELLDRTVKLIEQGNVRPIPQEELMDGIRELKTAPKLTKQDCKINWDNDVVRVYNFIRGLSPYPAAWTNFFDTKKDKTLEHVKIFKSTYEKQDHSLAPGTIVTDNENHLKIAAQNGFINVENLQLPGKKPVNIKEFLNGYDAKALKIV